MSSMPFLTEELCFIVHLQVSSVNKLVFYVYGSVHC